MGMFTRYYSTCSACTARAEKDSKNPDPTNFKILDYLQQGNNLLVKINYPNAKNFEGDKIMLYENVTLLQLINSKSIDPHFSNSKDCIAPIARFVPTEFGWKLGMELLAKL